MTTNRIRGDRLQTIAIVICSGIGASPTWAGSHLWRFNEMFTNANGTVQFIEM